MMALLDQTFNLTTVYNLYTVNISRFSHSLTVVAIALELNIRSGSSDDFNALHTRVIGGLRLGNLTTTHYAYLSGTILLTPGSE